MEHRNLGRSGLRVSVLGLGTMLFGETGSRGASEAVARDQIDRFLDAGGTHIDTANVYAGGESEAILGRALEGRRDRVTLATKVRFRTGNGPNDEGLSRHQILSSLKASLKRLKTDHVDVLYVHCWDPWTPIEETVHALDDVVRQGLVRYLGVSNFRAWQLAHARTLQDERKLQPFVAAQYQLSLVERNVDEEFLSLSRELGIGMVPWGPLGGGFLAGKYDSGDKPSEGTGRIATTPGHAEESWEKRNQARNWRVMERVKKIAGDLNATPSQVALAYLVAREDVSTVLLGARTVAQLEDNLGAAQLTLPADVFTALDEASKVEARYPYRMIDTYGDRAATEANRVD